MKTSIVLFCCFAAAVCAQFDTKYDNINLDEILNNQKLLNVYVRCLLEKQPCATKEAKYLKEVLPVALQDDCKKCSQKQKDGAKKAIKFLYRNKPEVWEEIAAKYDPKGVYQMKHKAEFQKWKN